MTLKNFRIVYLTYLLSKLFWNVFLFRRCFARVGQYRTVRPRTALVPGRPLACPHCARLCSKQSPVTSRLSAPVSTNSLFTFHGKNVLRTKLWSFYLWGAGLLISRPAQ